MHFIQSMVQTAAQSHLSASHLSPPNPLVPVSRALSDPYPSAPSVISSTLMSLSAVSVPTGSNSPPRCEPKSPCCRCRAAPSVIQHFTAAVWVEALTRWCWGDGLNGTLTPRLSFWRSLLFPAAVAAFGSGLFLSEWQWQEGRQMFQQTSGSAKTSLWPFTPIAGGVGSLSIARAPQWFQAWRLVEQRRSWWKIRRAETVQPMVLFCSNVTSFGLIAVTLWIVCGLVQFI